VDSYWWAVTWAEVETGLLGLGPMTAGMDWHGDMMDVDAAGFIHPSGGLVGGHCVKLDGINVPERKVRMKNSWGRTWGRNGFAWIRFEDLEYLLFGANGEAALAVEKRRAA
jgi:hypothetical protein